MEKKKNKLLTTGLDERMMAEFSAAAKVLGARSINALVHQMVHEKIIEAKAKTDAQTFAEVVAERIEEMNTRSQQVKKNIAEKNNNALDRI